MYARAIHELELNVPGLDVLLDEVVLAALALREQMLDRRWRSEVVLERRLQLSLGMNNCTTVICFCLMYYLCHVIHCHVIRINSHINSKYTYMSWQICHIWANL